MDSETIAYEADGRHMVSHLYRPADGAKAPGVLVFPDMFGLSEHTKGRARRLAEIGFVALACDLHGDGHILKDVEEVMNVRKTLIYNPSAIRARARGGLDALRARSDVDAGKMAAIGFCFGGRMALELARAGEDLLAAVAFHAGLRTEAIGDSKNIKGKVLVCTGSADPMATAADRAAFEAEMIEGGVDWQLHLYGGVKHSFTNPDIDALNEPGSRYDPAADRRSWSSMLRLFEEIF